MKPAIRVENLSKRYRIGTRPSGDYATLREAIVEKTAGVLRSIRNRRPAVGGDVVSAEAAGTFWALKDVSFEVKPGEVVGITGRNGAGKSTLLKVLSRITEPTAGRISLGGRIGSLLEVGTGFHQELTGRENIYLNGSILGMGRREIERKFDEIVAFSEVEQFLDTPVKRYSSGMYVRLAFAVAAHLDPEILIIDEVLAVGDIGFQSKCLRKMRNLSTSGRTILFVSHNVAALQQLCSKCVLLEGGRLADFGVTESVVGRYVASSSASDVSEIGLGVHPGRRAGGESLMKSLSLRSGDAATSSFPIGGRFKATVTFESPRPLEHPSLGIVIKDNMGYPLIPINNKFMRSRKPAQPIGRGTISGTLQELPLLPGRYSIDLYFGDQYRDYDEIRDAAWLTVHECDHYGTGRLPPGGCGSIALQADWEIGR